MPKTTGKPTTRKPTTGKPWPCVLSRLITVVLFCAAGCGGGSGGGGHTPTGGQASLPAAPTNLTATPISNSEIDLEWNDNSNNETGFTIERSDDGVLFSEVGTVPANRGDYRDSGLAEESEYFYRVAAYNSAVVSDYSNLAQAKTSVIPWARSYGGPGTDSACSIIATEDDGYVIAGETDSFGAGGFDCWIIKIDRRGVIEWEKVYGGQGDDRAKAITQVVDGGYVVVGSTDSFGSGEDDVFLMKLAPDGTVEWEETMGGADMDSVNSVRPTVDGGSVVAGTTRSFGNNCDCWFIKLDPAGAVEEQILFGGAGSDSGRSVFQAQDGGYVLAGDSDSFGVDGDCWILKLAPSGTIDWQLAYGGIGWEQACSARLAANGDIVVTGKQTSFNPYGAWVLRLNPGGAILEQNCYGDPSGSVPPPAITPSSILSSGVGGYLMVGWVYYAHKFQDSLVFELERYGPIVWQKVYDGGAADSALCASRAVDGGLIMTGSISRAASMNDVWTVKTNSDGTIDFNASGGAESRDTFLTAASTAAVPRVTSAKGVSTTVSPVATSFKVTDTKCDVGQQAP
jgi:hypothetical protein